MIRSLGSSLLAKAGVGSLSRKQEEERITKPNIPGKGAVGTSGRELVEETNITPVAPGSEKVIRSAPGVESASTPGMAANQVPLVAGMGTPGGAGAAGGAMRGAPGANNQALFQGGVSPASAPGQAGRQASVASSTGTPMGSVATVRAERAQAAAKAAEQESARVQAERMPFGGQGSQLPNIGIFGGKVSAYDPEGAPKSNAWQPTTGQYAAGALGKAINTVGQKLGNKLPELNISERLQNFGGSQTVAAAGKGSVETAVKNAGNALRSVVQQATNTWNKLRSKFGW